MKENKKIMLLLSVCFFVFSIGGEASGTDTRSYGIKYNNETLKNEIWLINEDGTSEFLADFKFPTNTWQPANSYSNTTDGKLYLFQSGNQACTGNPAGQDYSCRALTNEEKGWVVYDPKTNTFEYGVKNGYGSGDDNFQKTFRSVFALDDLISEETNGEIHIGENSLGNDRARW